MIEIPEAMTLARQLRETLTGRVIEQAVAGFSPHGFAWYFGEPEEYGPRLRGKTVRGALAYGGRPQLLADDICVSFGDGVNLRYGAPGAKRPSKHQLLIAFDDGSALYCTVQMYGGIWAFPEGANDDPYYLVAKQTRSVFDDSFDRAYFRSLLTDGRWSAKAFLATEQRIPGLGNGVLQDILWRAGIHPKRKMSTLTAAEIETLFDTVKSVLAQMTAGGGRDTEKDLFGNPGGYRVVMGRLSLGTGCPTCGSPIQRSAYLGGNVYICEHCQPL